MIARILVALDETGRAPVVFQTAAELAKVFSAELILFRAISIPPEFPAAGAGGQKDELLPHLTQAAQAALLDYAQKRPDVTSRVLVHAEYSAHQAILRAAEEYAVDLIVIGSHGYHGLDRILGTTAGRVTNLAHRNVFIVHVRADEHGGAPGIPGL